MSEEYNMESEETELMPDPGTPPAFADKVIGIFTSPGKTMAEVAKFPAKATDWLVPILIMIVIASLTAFLFTSNAKLKSEMEDKQWEAIEKSFQDKIDSGDLTVEQADQQRSAIEKQMNIGGDFKIFFQIFGIILYTFIIFFAANLYFFLIAKFGLKGDGSYMDAMAAYGYSYYILIAQAIVVMVLSLATEKIYMGLNPTSFIDVEWGSFSGFILRKIDPFLLWFYAVLGISYSKMFKSDNSTKYIIVVFAAWLIAGLFFFWLSTLSSVFQGFAM